MQIEVLKSKIHRATVTDANLNYEGSISIDMNLVKNANMHVWEKVDVLNVNNGARFSTYIIPGKDGEICLNGAAARMAAPGDKVIIVTYTHIEEQDADSWKPVVLLLDEQNKIRS
ncbi:MAG: aspartate 1-decarboxylase [Treponema sp.]|uniref:aspartate 1-decarboxylase n=1 Tax=Treponema sp. TaxID=166 RepID=UPI00298E34F3|nr:aspartate 1-decarboxylase [Treponema sp.]MBR5934460.1 aspartate 1-decarboxylase [Treponema sp.]